MDTVTISPKFQVVIPKRVRENMQLQPGEKLEVIAYDGRIEMIPLQPVTTTRGMVKGLDPTFNREKKDRL